MSQTGEGIARRLRARHPAAAEASTRDGASRSPEAGTGYVRPRVIFGAATALGLFSGFQAYYYVSLFTDWPASLPFLLALNLAYWYSWACLAPAILWLSSWAPFERGQWPRALAVHLPGVFVATVLHIALTVAGHVALSAVAGREPRSWSDESQRMFFNNFDWEMMTYWAIVGLSHALRYYREARGRALRESQLETRLVEAQLQALQRQLQPHFLFNTLNTISALMHRDVRAADDMIAKLGGLLRRSLQDVGVQEMPLAQELDFLSTYLEIERTRFRDRLSVVVDVEPATLDALVPTLVLQPLVENAIKHGIGPRPGPGHIAIRSRRVHDMLELEVTDDGVGLSAGRLNDGDGDGGIGLGNTRARLQHLYGAAHRFELRRPEGGGLSVRLAVPLVMRDAVEETVEDVA